MEGTLASSFLRLIRGEARGAGPALARLGLWIASLGYGLAARLRNLAYDLGWLRVHKASVPVISVGNLTAGGTGKTPCVEYVASVLRDAGLLVAILSRGYGATSGPNDEALVLEELLPDVPHLQGVDRAKLADAAVEELESQALVLDDGFQHRRLARDLDLVLLDATERAYHLLPRGLMREPFSSLARAHAIILTRCDQADEATLAGLRQRIAPYGKPVAESVHAPSALVSSSGAVQPLSSLHGQAVAAFCGLGNPEAFRRTLEGLGAKVAGMKAYPDHHPYSRADVDELARWGRSFPEGAPLITTHKDLVKLRVDSLGGRPLWALRVRLEVRAGQGKLDELIRGTVKEVLP
jgi:tetraacyldisaccharide 4'-kinase